jgi:PBSX family phage terminase large subunit
MEQPFVCHSEKQERLIFSDKKITAAITGIQWAKTTSGAWWMKRKMFEHKEPDDNFIITAPTYKIMKQSTLPAFLKIMDGFGEYKAGDAEFHMNGGGVAYMRTGTEPDSIVGITNVRAVWGDEAGKYSLYFWENIQGRASFKDAPIMLTSTPYAMNWFFKEILKPYKTKTRDDLLVIQAKSCDNPYFPMAEYERRRLTMDPRRFNAMYNGEFEKMQGLVYDCFSEETHVCEPLKLPLGTRYFAGVDWGTTHPFVISVRAVTPAGEHFQVSEFFKSGYTLMDFISVAEKLKQVWDIQTFYCDPSQPGYIEEFNRHGLSAIPADNDIRRGIDLHYNLMKEGKFKLFKGSNQNTIDGLETYHYPEPDDLGPDDASKEKNPVKQDDDAMDAMRYVTIMTYHSGIKKTPHVPGLLKQHESNEERIRRLKKGRGGDRRTERWG